MMVSNEIGADRRCKAVLKTRISPMLLVSTTDPLPAHRPWSGGSTSLKTLVVCSALSTAFRPFTPVAPPAAVLMRSQPGPSGWQLTDGTGKEEPSVRRAVGPRTEAAVRDPGVGMAWAESSVPDDPAPVPSWWPDAAAAVDGVLSGPVSRWQSMAHPVAAGPAKVGLNVPRLDVVTVSA